MSSVSRDETYFSVLEHQIGALITLCRQQEEMIKQYSVTVDRLQSQLRVLRETPPAPQQPTQLAFPPKGGFQFNGVPQHQLFGGMAAPAFGAPAAQAFGQALSVAHP